MTDVETLHQLVFQKPLTGPGLSKLGYFCAPFRPENGPFHDKDQGLWLSATTKHLKLWSMRVIMCRFCVNLA